MAATFHRPHKKQSRWIMFDRTVVVRDQRSQSVFLSLPPSDLRGISVWDRVCFMRVSVSLKILNNSVDFTNYFSTHVPIKSKGSVSSSSS